MIFNVLSKIHIIVKQAPINGNLRKNTYTVIPRFPWGLNSKTRREK